MNKRLRKKMHKKYLYDIALEISQSSFWRKKIFCSEYEEKILINVLEIDNIPKYIKNYFVKFHLNYYVSKTYSCPSKFDPDLIIFKFEAREFPNVVTYSGNNENIV